MVRMMQCHWCGEFNGEHNSRCNVPRLELYRDVTRNSSVSVCVTTKPIDEPTSLELFNRAQQAGLTVGHEWAKL